MPITLLGRSSKKRRSRKGGKKKLSCMTSRGRVKKGWRVAKGRRCVKAKRRR